MEKYILGFCGLAGAIAFGLLGKYFEGIIIVAVFYGAACICKKLEEIRDK